MPKSSLSALVTEAASALDMIGDKEARIYGNIGIFTSGDSKNEHIEQTRHIKHIIETLEVITFKDTLGSGFPAVERFPLSEFGTTLNEFIRYAKAEMGLRNGQYFAVRLKSEGLIVGFGCICDTEPNGYTAAPRNELLECILEEHGLM